MSKIAVNLLSFLLFLSAIAQGQEQLGLRLDRYAGIDGVILNPASSTWYPQKWDAKILGLAGFGGTTYMHINKTGVIDLLLNIDKIQPITDTVDGHSLKPGARVIDWDDRSKKVYGVGLARIEGPGFSVNFGDRTTVGLFTALRVHAGGYHIPVPLLYPVYDRKSRYEAFDVDPFKVTFATWIETGIHLAHRTEKDGGAYSSWGVNAKILLGLEGAYVHNVDVATVEKWPKDTLLFYKGRWDYGITTSNFPQADGSVKPKISPNGLGFAVDLGYSQHFEDDDSENETDYYLRLGGSILDLGFIQFSSNTQTHQIIFTDSIIYRKRSLEGISQPDSIFQRLSSDFMNDPLASRTGSSFILGMPTALSLQADYRFLPHIYGSALIVQRIPLFKYSLKRANTLAVVPRYERRWFAAAMPIILSDYRSLRLGLSVRLGVLTLGSDHLGSYGKHKIFNSSDFYMSLKINPFHLKFGKNGGGLGRSGRKWSKVGCFE